MFCFNASFQSLASSPQCVSLSSLPSVPLLSHNHALKTNSHYRKIGRDVIVMATGDAPAETEVPDVIALWGSTGLISVGMEEGLDCKLLFLVKMLNITWVSLHPHEISLKDIDQVAKTSFPLCMHHLFDKIHILLKP
ncbi:DNA primase, large subunit family [Trifolium repens]|nr:DNA primase, large subunit family [Trifolium repens]